MKIYLILLILIYSTTSLASVERTSVEYEEKPLIKASVNAATKYMYNIFYDHNRAITDLASHISPEIHGTTKPKTIYFKGSAGGFYEKYLAYSIQDHFDYNGAGSMVINEDGGVSCRVDGNYKSHSDPAANEDYKRINRTNYGASFNMLIKSESKKSVEIKTRYSAENFNNPNLTGPLSSYLSNNTIDGVVQYNNAFLPETIWFMRASGGMTQYTTGAFELDPNNISAEPKNNNFFGTTETGFLGRLTERSSVDCAVGFHFRSYQTSGSGFASPLFYLRFTEQVTRRDQMIAGYNYIVNNAYWSDYVLDQEIYIGLARVMGDQVLLLSRLSYLYKSYSLPVRRDDERIATAFSLRYSINSQIKLTADVKVDLLSSDVYNNQNSGRTNLNGVRVYAPDRPASYKNGTLGLGIIANY
ncbi:MAG: hypothetical protein SGI74_11140 [Oligoflexia bacterium]|nr:hypothetical protein [Oligoflexia bacterium]